MEKTTAPLSLSFANVSEKSPVLTKSRESYIISPICDWIFFIAAPLIAVAVSLFSESIPALTKNVFILGARESPKETFIGSFIMAHLFIVFFRSHLNDKIFKLHPVRFIWVPAALFIAMIFSQWVAVSVSVLATWWDVYHSSLQTFGIGRIYDMKMKNDLKVGRKLDILMNLLLYAGPILAGATLMDHVNDFHDFETVKSAFFTSIPAYARSYHAYLTWIVVGIGVPFIFYYVYAYWRLAQKGYQISVQKVALLAITGLCSIFFWGFNSFGEAFFVMNFFHAWQYFALVWFTEGKNITSFFQLDKIPFKKIIGLVLFILVGFVYGFMANASNADSHVAFSIVMVVSIMHFWYDGFIWSVQKKQV